MDENSNNVVRINLISSRKLDSMTSDEKLRFIIDEIKRGTVLILERGLTAEEEINLIKTTMSEINHQTFIGIEMQSYSARDLATDSWINRLLGRTKVPKMSVIGPANLLKTIHKDGTTIQAMILTGQSIVDNLPEPDDEMSGVEAEGVPGTEAEVADAESGVGTRFGAGSGEDAASEIPISETKPQNEVGAEQPPEPGRQNDEQVLPEQIPQETASPAEYAPGQLTEPATAKNYGQVTPAPESESPTPEQTTTTTQNEYPQQAEQPLAPQQNIIPPQERAQPQDQTQPPVDQQPHQQVVPARQQETHGTGFLYKRLKQEEE